MTAGIIKLRLHENIASVCRRRVQFLPNDTFVVVNNNCSEEPLPPEEEPEPEEVVATKNDGFVNNISPIVVDSFRLSNNA